MSSTAANLFNLYKQALQNTEGWFSPSLLKVILAISDAQSLAGCQGWLIEWGVHHGRGLAVLGLAAGAEEWVLGLDCFGEQELNRCGSGKGSLEATRATLTSLLGADHRVQLYATNLLKFEAQQLGSLLQSLPGGYAPVRLAHIDGDHTEQGALNDLQCAAPHMHDRGVILLDDVFNPDWPEVGGAFHRFLAQHPDWKSVGVAYSRTILCQLPFAHNVRDALTTFPHRRALFRQEPFIVLEWIDE